MSGGLLRTTLVACAAAAAVSIVAGSLAGHAAVGVGVAAGLLLGSLNGYLVQGLIVRGVPFMAASLMRILFFSSLVLMAALILRTFAWTFALGIGCAQLVMVAAGIRQGLRRA
ncbi:MAG TPA: hypothetical protein VEU76_03435 [Candidatus Udaeobacter sp.]|nr:hypothetical protein [Candidatus Udaeobacter sp.]